MLFERKFRFLNCQVELENEFEQMRSVQKSIEIRIVDNNTLFSISTRKDGIIAKKKRHRT